MNKKGQAGIAVVIILLVVVIALLVVLVGFRFNKGLRAITGRTIDLEPSELETRSYDLLGFEEIEILGRGDLHLVQGPDYDVKIKAEKNVLDILEVELKGNKLVIGERSNLLFVRKEIDIFITTPKIEVIKIFGSGDIQSKNKILSEELDIVITGDGDVDLDLEVNDLLTKIIGSGDVQYTGKVENHEISVLGSGSVKAFDLQTQNTKVGISGSGNAEVDAEDELEIRISGSGSVLYKGQPQLDQRVSGSGKVKSI